MDTVTSTVYNIVTTGTTRLCDMFTYTVGRMELLLEIFSTKCN